MFTTLIRTFSSQELWEDSASILESLLETSNDFQRKLSHWKVVPFFAEIFYTLNYYLMTWLHSHCPKLREWFTLATRHEQHVRQNRCHDRIVIAHKDLSKSSWAGSFKPILLFCGTTLDFIFVILSAKFAMPSALPSPINNSPPRLAKIPKKMNFHFQIFRETQSKNIIFQLSLSFQCWLSDTLLKWRPLELRRNVSRICAGIFKDLEKTCPSSCVISSLNIFLFQILLRFS